MDPTDLGCDPGLTQTALAWVSVPDDPARPIVLRRVEIAKAPKNAGPAAMVASLRRVEWSLPPGHPRHVVCESQQVHHKRSGLSSRKGGDGKVDPAVLIGLAHVSGAVAALADGTGDIDFPDPQEWKGNLDKVVYHEAVLLALGGQAEGWGWDVAGSAREPRLVPRSPPVGASLPGGAWLHLLDAVGLVMWKTRGKQWRKDVLDRSTDPLVTTRRKWAERAAALPDSDGLLRP